MKRDCLVCNGTGRVTPGVSDAFGLLNLTGESKACDACSGSGQIDEKPLQASEGPGIVYTPEELRALLDEVKAVEKSRTLLQAENTALVLKNRELTATLEARKLEDVSMSLYWARLQNSAFAAATPEILAKLFYEASTLAGQALKELVRKGISPDRTRPQ